MITLYLVTKKIFITAMHFFSAFHWTCHKNDILHVAIIDKEKNTFLEKLGYEALKSGYKSISILNISVWLNDYS